ncbi:hypothetical protein [[Leptolyngbya] sp. PCC 7376]|uniref:hypothetical protein n=1 Tax=[Leptolyngbya] sp. PCC 7376 TaxID=111781 RepID=UPI00030D38B5|nr:hypothetical protein [[Leptolyngbya] sp. PCC 7376]
MFPRYWSDFLAQHYLTGKSATIPKSKDLSGLGAELQFFNENEAIEESEEFYPGIAVAPDGFIPVAICLIGSGDPYFINRNDGINGALYRVYHDVVAVMPYSKFQPSKVYEVV